MAPRKFAKIKLNLSKATNSTSEIEEPDVQTPHRVLAVSTGQSSGNLLAQSASNVQGEDETLVHRGEGQSRILQVPKADLHDQGCQPPPSSRTKSQTAPRGHTHVGSREKAPSALAPPTPALTEMAQDVPRELRVDGWVQPVMVAGGSNDRRMLRSHMVASSAIIDSEQPADSTNVQATNYTKGKGKARRSIKRESYKEGKGKAQETQSLATGSNPGYCSDSDSILTFSRSDLLDADHGRTGDRVPNTSPVVPTSTRRSDRTIGGYGMINRNVESIESGASSFPTNPPVEYPNQRMQIHNVKRKRLSPSAEQLLNEATIDNEATSWSQRNKRQKVIHVTSGTGIINTTSAGTASATMQKTPNAKGKEKIPAIMDQAVASNPSLNELNSSQQNQQRNQQPREFIAEKARTRSGRQRPLLPLQMEAGEGSNAPNILARRTRNRQVPLPPTLPKSRISTTNVRNSRKEKSKTSSVISKPKGKRIGRSGGKGKQNGKDYAQGLSSCNPVNILANAKTASEGHLLLSIGRDLLNLEIPGGTSQSSTLGRFLEHPEKRFMASAGDEYNPSQGLDYTWTLGNRSTAPGRGVGKRRFGRRSRKAKAISSHNHDHGQTLTTPIEGYQFGVDDEYPQLMGPDGKGYKLGDNERVQNGGRLFGEEEEDEEEEKQEREVRVEPKERNIGCRSPIGKGRAKSRSSSKSPPPLSPFSKGCFDLCIQLG